MGDNRFAEAAREEKATVLADFVLERHPHLTVDDVGRFSLETFSDYARSIGVNPPSEVTAALVRQFLIEALQPDPTVAPPGEPLTRPRTAAEALVGRTIAPKPVATPLVGAVGERFVEVDFTTTTVETRRVAVREGWTLSQIVEAASTATIVSNRTEGPEWTNFRQVQ